MLGKSASMLAKGFLICRAAGDWFRQQVGRFCDSTQKYLVYLKLKMAVFLITRNEAWVEKAEGQGRAPLSYGGDVRSSDRLSQRNRFYFKCPRVLTKVVLEVRRLCLKSRHIMKEYDKRRNVRVLSRLCK
ncbi:unnamed protein product [Hapterophycus canaliculatus]